jgi:hypothetical protein
MTIPGTSKLARPLLSDIVAIRSIVTYNIIRRQFTVVMRRVNTYDSSVKTHRVTTRPVPTSLADVVAGLELRQPKVVTRELLKEVAREVGSTMAPEVLTERLVRAGWLLPLRLRNAWEFAPGAHAGRYGWSDPWIELRALLLHEPNAPVAIAFESSLWELGHTTHQPAKTVLAHRPKWIVPRVIGARSISFDWRLPTVSVRGLPVWQEATALVGAASRPAAQGDWGNADNWLGETFRSVTPEDVIEEATGRGNPSLARLGYMAEWAGSDEIAELIDNLLPKSRDVTYFGPRKAKGRWINRWRLYDAVLPQR